MTLIMPSPIVHSKSIAASMQELPDSVVSQLVQVAIESKCQAKQSHYYYSICMDNLM